MMNYYELINLLKGNTTADTLSKIRESFHDSFVDELEKIHFNNSSRKAAAKSYTSHATHFGKVEKFTILTDGVTALYTNNGLPESGVFSEKLADNLVKVMCGGVARPADFWYKESEAVARALGWKPGKNDITNPYFVDIEGNLYNFTLVYNVFSALVDGKEFTRVELVNQPENGNYKTLRVTTKHGIGIVLPICAREGFSGKNVNVRYYMDHEKELDNYIMESIAKGA